MMIGTGIFKVPLPQGFKASGVHSGVRLYRHDLGLIVSEKEAVTAAVYTQNALKGAPVFYSKKLTPSSRIKAIITNSGEANAGTGMEGIHHNQMMVNALAEHLQCESEQILTASTGVIGKVLSVDKIVKAMPALINNLHHTAENFAAAILTTDLVPKCVYKKIQLSTGAVSITGICKGSGMIHPNMATMLGYFLTDAQLSLGMAEKLLKNSCEHSFNQISVDGETSTNDTVFLMANGMSNVSIHTENDYQIFAEALMELAILLAKSIVRDGEGATKLIEIAVSGASSQIEAQQIAKSLITSPLVKTAIAGQSPNWGRILARIGQTIQQEQMLMECDIVIQNITVFSNGYPALCNQDVLREKLHDKEISIAILFKSGDSHAVAWGCDMTENYVKINAEYLS